MPDDSISYDDRLFLRLDLAHIFLENHLLYGAFRVMYVHTKTIGGF